MSLEMKVTSMSKYRCTCDICGRDMETRLQVSIEDDGATIVQDVCSTCVYCGPETAAQQMRDHASLLRQRADFLDRDARRIETMTDGWLTLFDLTIGGSERTDAERAKEAADWELRIKAIELGDDDALREFDAKREQEYRAEHTRQVVLFRKHAQLIQAIANEGDRYEWTDEAMDAYRKSCQSVGMDALLPF